MSVDVELSRQSRDGKMMKAEWNGNESTSLLGLWRHFEYMVLALSEPLKIWVVWSDFCLNRISVDVGRADHRTAKT